MPHSVKSKAPETKTPETKTSESKSPESKAPETRALVFDFVLFQSIWIAGVMLQNSYLAVLFLIVRIAIGSYKTRDRHLIIFLAPVGILLDFVLMQLDVMRFESGWFPVWLAAIWCGFVMTLGASLAWLGKRPWWMQSLFGAVGGAMSYWAGARFGAVEFGYSLPVTLAVFTTIWATGLPLAYRLIRRHTPATSYSAG